MSKFTAPAADLPPGYDLEAEDDVAGDFWEEFMDAVPSFWGVYRKGEAAGFKRGFERGFEAARAVLLQKLAAIAVEAPEPQPLRIEGPKAAPPPLEGIELAVDIAGPLGEDQVTQARRRIDHR